MGFRSRFYYLLLKGLDMLFNDRDDGQSIKNGLHSIWLLFFSDYISKPDETKIKKMSEATNNLGFNRQRMGSAIISDSEFSFFKNN